MILSITGQSISSSRKYPSICQNGFKRFWLTKIQTLPACIWLPIEAATASSVRIPSGNTWERIVCQKGIPRCFFGEIATQHNFMLHSEHASLTWSFSKPPCRRARRFSEYKIIVAPHCTSFNESAFRWALSNRPDTVILSALWPLDPDSLSKLDATVTGLRAAHLPVIVVGETPRYPGRVPDILARRLLRGDHDTRAGSDAIMGSSYNGDIHMKGRYSGLQGVRYLSYVDTVCDEPSCPLVTPPGVPIYFDADHLTTEGAQWVVGRLFAQGLLMNTHP